MERAREAGRGREGGREREGGSVATRSCSKNKRRRQKNRKTDQEIVRNSSLPSVFP